MHTLIEYITCAPFNPQSRARENLTPTQTHTQSAREEINSYNDQLNIGDYRVNVAIWVAIFVPIFVVIFLPALRRRQKEREEKEKEAEIKEE